VQLERDGRIEKVPIVNERIDLYNMLTDFSTRMVKITDIIVCQGCLHGYNELADKLYADVLKMYDNFCKKWG